MNTKSQSVTSHGFGARCVQWHRMRYDLEQALSALIAIHVYNKRAPAHNNIYIECCQQRQRDHCMKTVFNKERKESQQSS